MTELTDMRAIDTPEWQVLAKAFLAGLIGTELFRIGFQLGLAFLPLLTELGNHVGITWAIAICALGAVYGWCRNSQVKVLRLARSGRWDLLAMVALGGFANVLLGPSLASIHEKYLNVSPWTAPTVLAFAFVVMASSIKRQDQALREPGVDPGFFHADSAALSEDDDILGIAADATSFAETVLDSLTQPALIYGLDGPWGVGKTSFVNLAHQRWLGPDSLDRAIVFRFEPLRHASEANLTDLFIRDLCAAISSQVFAPEFAPVASRYSRMLKGKADVSFLGFKIALEPAAATLDEMLDAIDSVLARVRRRLIVVVDDLDRLDIPTVNNILYTVRRTMRLARATYVLCYDTDNLVDGRADSTKAREFLEKFVNVKLSLFIDYARLVSFIEQAAKAQIEETLSLPSRAVIQQNSIRDLLATILKSPQAHRYAPLIGDLRKIKRFLNTILLIRIDQTDFSVTDFDRRDLVHLVLLYQNFPGVFRRIYADETEGRSGIFGVVLNYSSSQYQNAPALTEFIDQQQDGPAKFLLHELFVVGACGVSSKGVTEDQRTQRACFNDSGARNLEKYLRLIVRFTRPEPVETHAFYKNAAERVVAGGQSVRTALKHSAFDLREGEAAQDRFWTVLVNRSAQLKKSALCEAIDTLVEALPQYSSVDKWGKGLRVQSMYSLARLLNELGNPTSRSPTDAERQAALFTLAQRIFGHGAFAGRGILHELAAEDRGVTGWDDLLTFRLLCCADRGGQLRNIDRSLLQHANWDIPGSYNLHAYVVESMRQMTQQVYANFAASFVVTGKSFVQAVDDTPDVELLGRGGRIPPDQSLEDACAQTRTSIKLFVLYQLCNRIPANGSGLGCGHFDPQGQTDRGQIRYAMGEYLFNVCFEPSEHARRLAFADFCLSQMRPGHSRPDGPTPTPDDFLKYFDADRLSAFWSLHRDSFLLLLAGEDRRVVTVNYVATYRADLARSFDVLDSIAKDAFVGPPSLEQIPEPELRDAEPAQAVLH